MSSSQYESTFSNIVVTPEINQSCSDPVIGPGFGNSVKIRAEYHAITKNIT